MKTLKITIWITTTFFMLFLFTSSVFAQLEFVGNYNNNMGGAGWDADGSGPEPYGYGHGNIFYYVASRDYVDGEDYCGAQMTDVLNGFPEFELSLTENGYSTEQVTLKFALADLGDDAEGIDYFTIGDMDYCNFYPVVIIIELDGEALVEAIGNYSMYISGPGVREFESGYLKINNISGSSTEPVQNVANAFLEDIDTEELQFVMQMSENVESLWGYGRSGAYVNIIGTFEKGLPEIPFEGLYENHQGFASWDADGTGPEPFGDGHDTQLYYLTSPDYDSIDPDPNACLVECLEGQTGFLNTALQLEYRGFEINDMKLKLGLTSLGPDIEGEDWGDNWDNYYNNALIIELNNEPILAVLNDTSKAINAGGYYFSEASIGKVYNISDNASPGAQFVAQSFLKDLGTHHLKVNASDITHDNSNLLGNGRDGAFYDINAGSMLGVHEQATFIPEGTVSGTWTIENSPYYIEGPVVVENDQTLVIESGVRVAVRGPHPITIKGNVVAEGTVSDKIMFTASNPNITWDGLDYEGDYIIISMASVFDHCIFQYGYAQGTESSLNSGGIFAVRDYDNLKVYNSVFRNNKADIDGEYPPSGGAVALWNASPLFQNCTFYNNSAYLGGAVLCYNGSSPEISRSLFYNNISEHDGGAIQIYENSHPNIINNTFSLNTADNYGGAVDVYLNSDPVFVNNIFWGNTASNYNPISITTNDCDISVTYSDVQGDESDIGPFGIPSGNYENNIDEDPLFLDIANYNFLLDSIAPSLCIDTGDPAIATDPDGSPADRGCYYQYFESGIANNSVSDLRVYPNPATSVIYFNSDFTLNENSRIEIFNFLGQKVDELKITSSGKMEIPLDISNYESGTYFCKVTSGSKVYTAKFVKK